MKVIELQAATLNESRGLIKDYLFKGKLVMMPTDTIDGISVRADDKKAVERVYQIKKREKGKSLLILVSSISMLKKYCYLNSKQEIKLKNLWRQERPTTVLLLKKKLLAPNISSNEYLAVRLPKSDFLRKMIKSLRVPIVSTSLNISGEKNLSTTEAINAFRVNNLSGLVVLDPKKNYSKIKASRLISIGQKGELKILRN